MKLEDILNKYNYKEPVVGILKNIYSKLVSYFQDEKIVYDALNSVEIVLTDDMAKYLLDNGLFSEEEKEDFKEFSKLNLSLGSYCSNPIIEYKGFEYKIVDIKRVILINIPLFKDSSEQLPATIIHEICHLIKSINNEYEIKGDTLVEHCGFRTLRYQLDNNNGSVVKKPVLEDGVGIEEGLNSVLEDEVFNTFYSKDESLYIGYDKVKELASELLEVSLEVKEAIIRAQVSHDYRELNKLLGIDFYKMIDVFDNVFSIDNEYLDTQSSECRSYLSVKYNTVKALMFNPLINWIKLSISEKKVVK